VSSVFIVTYSDWDIHGIDSVWTTQEEADKRAAEQNAVPNSYSHTVDEHPLEESLGEIVTDAKGIKARMTKLRYVKQGDKIVGGWMPWPVVAEVERRMVADKARIIYENRNITQWLDLDQKVPVLVED
jgi:hypothetical protein